MFKFVSAVVGFFLATGLFWLGIAFEYRPAHWPDYHLQTPMPFVHFTVDMGTGLAAQRDAYKADFLEEKAVFAQEKAAVDAQNAAIAALKVSADAWQVRAQEAVQRATTSNAWRLTLAEQILHTPRPADPSPAAQCASAEAILREGGR